MPEYLGADRVFAGTTFQKAVVQLETYDKPPAEMTPLDIINWAIDVGQWERVGVPGQQSKVWVGPAEAEPKPGGPLAFFAESDKAVKHMHRQYESWFEQRTFFLHAIEFIRFGNSVETMTCEKCGEKMKVQYSIGGLPEGTGYSGLVKCKLCEFEMNVQVPDPSVFNVRGLACPKCDGEESMFPPDAGEEKS